MPDPLAAVPAALFGAWTFDPAASTYGATPLPREAIYTLLPVSSRGEAPGAVAFWVGWAGADGERHATAFEVVPDGVARPFVAASATAEVRGAMEGDALVTELLVGGAVVHRAERRVSAAPGEALEDGEAEPDAILTVVQEQAGARTVGIYRRSRVKQVIVYRRDLNMRKGKIAAQVAHASMKALLDFDGGGGPRVRLDLPGPMAVWVRSAFAKVVLSVEGEAELDAVYEHARRLGIPAARITDAGRTEFKGVPTRTTVAVGPWTVEQVDRVTGPGGLVETKLA